MADPEYDIQAQRDGTLAHDGKGTPIQAPTGSQNRDDSGTPKESPVSLTTVQTLQGPANATHLVVRPTGADLLIGDNTDLDNSSPAAGEGTYFVPANAEGRFPCSNGKPWYVKAASGTCLLYLRYDMVTAKA